MPRSRKRVICELLDKLLPLVPRAITALGRQAHFLKKFCVSRVATQIFEQRISLDLGQSGVSLFVGMVQPFKRFVGLPAIRIYLSDLIGHISAILRDKAG